MSEKGGISVQTQHIFPVIKKWLYSEKDIFLREVVSNASDAITKVKHLSAIGEAKNVDGDFVIKVIIDKDAGTLAVTDNGIGMSEEEVKKYALSVEQDLLEFKKAIQQQHPDIVFRIGSTKNEKLEQKFTIMENEN